MPGIRERKLHMMGETKSSRGDYDETKSYMGGGKIKGYKKGGKIPGYMGGGGVMGMETSYKKKDRRP